MVSRVSLAVAMCLVFVGVPSEVRAQGMADCGSCQDNIGAHGWVHTFGEPGAILSCDGPGSVGCHLGDYLGNCTQYHDTCEAIQTQLVEEAEAAVGLLDGFGLRELVARNARVVVEAQHGRIAILDCQGITAVRIAIPDEMMAVAVMLE